MKQSNTTAYYSWLLSCKWALFGGNFISKSTKCQSQNSLLLQRNKYFW